MNRQIFIAILFASIAALLTHYYISEKEAAIKADVTPVYVWVAKSPVARGSKITNNKVVLVEIPGAYVMPGAISGRTRKDANEQWQKYQSQFAIVAIAKGEQILPNKLSDLVAGFSGAVKEGYRIASFAMTTAAAVGGHVRPGNHVDVLGTFEHQFKNQKRTTTVVLVQNVLVTATGADTLITQEENMSGKKRDYNQSQLIVSLSLSPEDALRLNLAEKEGELKLALRALNDDQVISLRDQHLGTLLSPLMRVQKEQIKPVKKRIQIIKGLQ